MKEEMQKMEMENIESYPRENRLEAKGIAGAQTFMEITEGKLTEVQIDEQHLLELIVSPYNNVSSMKFN